MRGGDFVGFVWTEFVIVKKPGGIENPNEQIGQPDLDGFGEAFEQAALKEGKQKEEADAFDTEEIFGGEDAADLQEQGDDDVGLFVCM